MVRNGIFSQYSGQLKGFLGEKGGVFAAGSVVMDGDSTFSETIMGLRQEIFQYDEERLKEIDSAFDHEYLRKFIHYTMQLSEIGFFSGITYLLKEGSWKWIEREDFQYLETDIRIDYDLQRLLPNQHNLHLQVSCATIRNIQQFLREIEFVLENQPLYRNKEWKRDAIMFFLIKHCMYDLYQVLDRFRGERSLLDVLFTRRNLNVCEILILQIERRRIGWKWIKAIGKGRLGCRNF